MTCTGRFFVSYRGGNGDHEEADDHPCDHAPAHGEERDAARSTS